MKHNEVNSNVLEKNRKGPRQPQNIEIYYVRTLTTYRFS